MAGSSMAFTWDDGVGNTPVGDSGIRKLIVDWVSDSASGAVSGTTTIKIAGLLVKGITNPGATAPTDNYDIAITDGESFDVLTNCGNTLANRDTATTEEAYFFLKDSTGSEGGNYPVVCDLLTIAITAAGNSKVGRLILYFIPL